VNLQYEQSGMYVNLLTATLRARRVSLIHVTFLPHCGEIIESRANFNL